MAQSTSKNEPVKMILLVTAQEHETAKRLANAQGVKVADIFRQALAVYDFLDENLGSGEQELRIENGGEVVTLKIVT